MDTDQPGTRTPSDHFFETVTDLLTSLIVEPHKKMGFGEYERVSSVNEIAQIGLQLAAQRDGRRFDTFLGTIIGLVLGADNGSKAASISDPIVTLSMWNESHGSKTVAKELLGLYGHLERPLPASAFQALTKAATHIATAQDEKVAKDRPGL